MTRREVLLACGLSLRAQTTPARLPHFEREALSNGVTLCVMEKRDAPLLVLRAVVRGGMESEQSGIAGVASVVAEMLRHGSGTLSAARYGEATDQIGTELIASVDEQCTAVAMEALPEYSEPMARLFADAIVRPRFDDDEVQRVVARSVDQTRSLKNSTGDAAWQYFNTFYFGKRHPYGRPRRGDEVTVQRITARHVRDYHRRMYAGGNLTVIAIGNLPPDRLRELLLKEFSGAARGGAYRWRKADSVPQPVPGPRLLLADKPEGPQTDFRIGMPGIHRTHPDRVAVWLVNTVVGGNFTSLLNRKLRVESGLTYGAYSYWSDNRLPGPIVISSSTPIETTKDALDLAVSTVRQVAEVGVSDAQLASAKAYIKGSYPPAHLQTSSQLAQVLGELELFGLGRGEIDTLFDRLDAVTTAQASEVAHKYFGFANPAYVLVGDAARIRLIEPQYAQSIWETSLAAAGFGLYSARGGKPPQATRR